VRKGNSIRTVLVIFAVLGASLMFLAPQPAQRPLRIGTYDSRAIPIAYAFSEIGAREMRDFEDQYRKAKAAGDEKLIKELEAKAIRQHQAQMVQAFSPASVAQILEKVKSDLPKVAKEAGVDLIVSQWDLVYYDRSAEVVDVTSGLVKLFNPREAAYKTIEEIRKQAPVPLAEAIAQAAEEGKN